MELRIADADGAGRPSSSSEPIMSPAWSPDGRQIAHVSFENAQPSIWVQELLTGKREKLTRSKGHQRCTGVVTGRPLSRSRCPGRAIPTSSSWISRGAARSPDKAWRHRHRAAWAPDGKSLVFTSDRGGSPDLQRFLVSGGEASRCLRGPTTHVHRLRRMDVC